MFRARNEYLNRILDTPSPLKRVLANRLDIVVLHYAIQIRRRNAVLRIQASRKVVHSLNGEIEQLPELQVCELLCLSLQSRDGNRERIREGVQRCAVRHRVPKREWIELEVTS